VASAGSGFAEKKAEEITHSTHKTLGKTAKKELERVDFACPMF
jgi:hypothetical protein